MVVFFEKLGIHKPPSDHDRELVKHVMSEPHLLDYSGLPPDVYDHILSANGHPHKHVEVQGGIHEIYGQPPYVRLQTYTRTKAPDDNAIRHVYIPWMQQPHENIVNPHVPQKKLNALATPFTPSVSVGGKNRRRKRSVRKKTQKTRRKQSRK